MIIKKREIGVTMNQINVITNNSYKGNNANKLKDKKFRSNVWGTYAQWNSVGKVIKSGSKGVKCVYVKQVDNKDDVEFKTYTLFNSEQTTKKYYTLSKVA